MVSTTFVMEGTTVMSQGMKYAVTSCEGTMLGKISKGSIYGKFQDIKAEGCTHDR